MAPVEAVVVFVALAPVEAVVIFVALAPGETHGLGGAVEHVVLFLRFVVTLLRQVLEIIQQIILENGGASWSGELFFVG